VPTSRRAHMTTGAAAAATAVVGTAAVTMATAAPAAAAPGLFDGDPAVVANADPPSGLAIKAEAELAVLLARSTATTGSGSTISATSKSPDSVSVSAENTATSGAASGLVATSASTGGVASKGVSSAVTGATIGVLGETASSAGFAVAANASNNGTGMRSHSNRTQLLLTGAPAAPPGAGLARVKGELVFDTNGDLWACVANGTPGTWRKVAGPSTAGSLTVLPSTVRIYDSRAGNNPVGVVKGQLGNFASRTIDAKVGSAVPAGATAVLVNLTIVNTGDPGYLGLHKNGIAWPGNSTINWNQPNTLLANSAICALDDLAQLAVKSNVGFCDFVIDAIGYYR
jgi:hypothetical protein